jgi:phage terminase large subunit-like protein
MTFALTDKQMEAHKLMCGDATHIMLEGGSRSGKTAIVCRNVGMRAIKAKGSRHLIGREHFNHCIESVMLDTFPKIMALAFPDLDYTINKQHSYARMSGDSEIWFAGFDDKERVDKVLGREYATVAFNETSQISFGARTTVLSRLAQKVTDSMTGETLKLRAYYDQNPGNKAHWTYKLFHQKLDPDTKKPLANPQDYATIRMNPADNVANISPEYIRLLESQSSRFRQRFLYGEYADENPNALFPMGKIDDNRNVSGDVPDMVRIVVAVDPSGSGDKDNAHNDAIGIAVCGLGVDGKGYLLEDCTVKAGPATWGKVATAAYDRHSANCIIGEGNYGGAMVEHVIKTAKPGVPYKQVTATRGKQVRAEPIAALYDTDRIIHAGYFPELEDELAGFSTNGYNGESSPNRADAVVWGFTELFEGMVNDRSSYKHITLIPTPEYNDGFTF